MSKKQKRWRWRTLPERCWENGVFLIYFYFHGGRVMKSVMDVVFSTTGGGGEATQSNRDVNQPS